jgi:NitT/TauT family transport system substrate-binding protein
MSRTPPLSRAGALRVAAALAAAGGAPRAAWAQAEPAPLHVATIPAETDATSWYALDLGLFRQNGLDVTVEVFTNGGAITAGLLGGTLDIGVTSVGSVATAHARGLPVVIAAPGGIYNSTAPTTVLAVTAASPLRTAKDLAGKTIGLATLGELGQYTTMAWLDKNGGDAKSVKFVELPTAVMADALEHGRIDAAFIAEPFFTQAKPAIRFFGAGYDGIAKRFLNTGWLGHKEWLDKNLPVAKRFVAAMRAAAVWANAPQNAAASGAILAKYTKLDPELIARMQRAQFATTLDPAMIQPVIDVSAAYKVIPASYPAAELIYAPTAS